MTTYEILCNTNWEMIKGKIFSDTEKQEITKSLLSAVSSEDTIYRFHKGVKAPDDGRIMYPLFYIPPYNDGKKFRLITGELPKTHILSANHYELEILRILALWDKDNPKVQFMLDETSKRLNTTCFAHSCSLGECISVGVSVLRFLSVIRPRNDEWINEILTSLLKEYNNGTKGSTNKNIPVFYMYAAISDIANGLCRELVENKKEWLMYMIQRDKFRKGSNKPPVYRDLYNVTLLYVLKNALSILPEFEYIENRPVVISENDNRCYCDI